MTEKEIEILKKAEKFGGQKTNGNADGHDSFHIQRVRSMAARLANDLGANQFIVELASLLHDVADPKLNANVPAAEVEFKSFVGSLEISESIQTEVLAIVLGQSFSKTIGVEADPLSEKSLEFQIVQDADRLDAIGAIGIARCFAYGGAKGNAMHDPELQPRIQLTINTYHHGQQSSLNHFHEKLFLLIDKLNTSKAREIAQERNAFMQEYVRRFHLEWPGKQ